MPGISISQILLVGLSLALVLAAYTDWRRRRIDNWLNAGIALAAPLFWWAMGLGLAAVGWQVALALAALVVLAGMFAIGALGGGDVKLLVALALWLRPAVFGQMLLVMGLVGGGLTVVLALAHAMRRPRGPLMIPYGLAIAFAGLWVLWGGAPMVAHG